MPSYRIRIERIDMVNEREPQWKPNAKPDGTSAYVMPPEGITKRISEEVYDQTVDNLDLAGLVRAINTPNGFSA